MMTDREYFEKLFRESMVCFVWFLLGVVLCGIISVGVYRCQPQDGVVVKSDTVVVVDTIRHDSLVPVMQEVVRVKKIPILQHDSIFVLSNLENIDTTDSLVLPITQKVYTDDSTYTAWVSGYEAALDSIETYRRKEVITNTISVKSRKRWHVGVQGGFYATPKGFQPGLGVGVTYQLWPP